MAREANTQVIDIKVTEKKQQRKILDRSDLEPLHYVFNDPKVRQAMVEKIIKLVDEQKDGEGGDTEFKETMRKCENMYSMKIDYRKPKNKRMWDIATPLVMMAVDHNVDKVMDVTFSQPGGSAQVLPGNKRDETEKQLAEFGQDILNARLQMFKDNRIRHENIFRTAFKFGDGWSKQVWIRKQEVRIREETIDVGFGPEIIEFEGVVTVDEGPAIIWLDPKDVIFPKNIRNPLEGPWICHQYCLTPEEIKLRMVAPKGERPEFKKRKVTSSPEEGTENEGDAARKDEVASTDVSGLGGFKRLYEMYISWQSPADELPSEWIITVNATDREMERGVRSELEERPLSQYSPIPIEGKPRSRPLPMMLLPLWRYVNTALNQIGDTASYAADPGGLADETTGLTKNAKGIGPGVFKKVKAGMAKDSVVFYTPPDVSQGIFKVLQLLLMFYEQMTGITEAEQGRFPEGVERPTSRGLGMLLGKTAIRFEKMNGNVQAGLGRAYRQMLWMMVHIGGDAYFERFVDERGIASEYIKEELANVVNGFKTMKWDVQVLGNPVVADKGRRKREAEQLFKLLIDIAMRLEMPDKVAEITQWFVGEFEARGLEGFTKDLREKVEAAFQQKAQKEALEAAPGGQPPATAPATTIPEDTDLARLPA